MKYPIATTHGLVLLCLKIQRITSLQRLTNVREYRTSLGMIAKCFKKVPKTLIKPFFMLYFSKTHKQGHKEVLIKLGHGIGNTVILIYYKFPTAEDDTW